MSFSAAAKIAKLQADRAGLIIHHMAWRGGHLEWAGRPKKEAMRLASGSEVIFKGKRGDIVSLMDAPEAPKSQRGIGQGQLL